MERENKINDYFNRLVKWISTEYESYSKIIIGYNAGWKRNVNMGRTNNRNFYEIPYAKLINKLRDVLEKNNQELVIIEESYTSKCDALSLEPIKKKANGTYLGKRVKRGLFSSAIRVLLNADLNGAINILRKWYEKNGKIYRRVKGQKLCNPVITNIP